MRTYKKGVYRISELRSDGKIDVIIYDGELWWLPGWEIGLKLADFSSSFFINESLIKELLWEWTPSK